MRDIYLIDFENVASEGLSGITYLSEDDQVIIFYSNNSNRLSMKMHILIGKSVCQLDYFEVTVGGKNALDHQISTWLGYLVGTGAAERNYYIVSRDMGYKHVANFWSGRADKPKIRCIDAIKSAGRLERNRLQRREAQVVVDQSAEDISSEMPAAAEPEHIAPETVPVQELPAEAIAADLTESTIELCETAVTDAPEMTEFSVIQEGAEPAVIPEQAEIAESIQIAEAETKQEMPTQRTEETVPPMESDSPAVETVEAAEPEEAGTGHRNGRNNNRRNRYQRSRNKRKSANVQVDGTEEAQSADAEKDAKPEGPKEPEKTAEKLKESEKAAEKKPAQPQQNRSRDKAREESKIDNPKGKSSDQLIALIAPYPKLQAEQLQELIAANKRQVLCNTLRKQLGQEKGLALYNEIKKSAWR